MNVQVKDMPKLESPFVREMIEGSYIVIDEVQEGYHWVFEDDSVMAVEKIDGTNVSLVLEDGEIMEVWNRKNHVSPFSKNKWHHFIIKGILNSIAKGYLKEMSSGQYFGELVGPKINGNPYDLEQHLWIPFKEYSRRYLSYHSWGKYPKTFESISEWFKEGLFSLFYAKRHDIPYSEAKLAEGIVFTHPDGRMAKLRRDMFSWYEGKRHNQ
jgi:hypothetical protein